jgi:hypothetical protein
VASEGQFSGGESGVIMTRKSEKLFSTKAGDKPVEKPSKIFMAYCFSTKKYSLPKK